MKISKDMKVGVLLGGLSSEREVSLRSGTAMAAALKARGYKVATIDVGRDLPSKLTRAKIDVAVNALHGKWGEDGCVQGLLEVMGIPYTGSGVVASAICMDKAATKRILSAAGLSTASFIELRIPAKGVAAYLESVESPFGYPVVVKPNSEGSSVGVEMVQRAGELQRVLKGAARKSKHLLLEKFIAGRELSVAVLDGKPLGTVEIKTRRNFYDYKAKYTKGETEYLVPAPLDAVVERRLMDEAARVHTLLGCRGVSRVDFILAEGLEGNILEINTLPGMTELSLVPKIAAGAGYSYEDLCEEILKGASLSVG
ncbi:MAG: D-alanine--D-alanine ligase [Chrysiogenetes bacterium]|nr:D-alanine--D-alanine ligase [Chrysiogenetes bacterium]